MWCTITEGFFFFLSLVVSECRALNTSSSRAAACGSDWIMTCAQMVERLVVCVSSPLAAADAASSFQDNLAHCDPLLFRISS